MNPLALVLVVGLLPGADADELAPAQSPRADCEQGTVLLRKACAGATPDIAALQQAADYFRGCLAREAEARGDRRMFDTARHNLQLTRLLLARAAPRPPQPQEPAGEGKPDRSSDGGKRGEEKQRASEPDAKKGSDPGAGKEQGGKDGKKGEAKPDGSGGDQAVSKSEAKPKPESQCPT